MGWVSDSYYCYGKIFEVGCEGELGRKSGRRKDMVERRAHWLLRKRESCNDEDEEEDGGGD